MARIGMNWHFPAEYAIGMLQLAVFIVFSGVIAAMASRISP
jgi:hypothetical protein